MFKNNLFYLLFIVTIFILFINVLDTNKVKADILISKVSYDELKYQWVVAEVIDIQTGDDHTEEYKSKVFQFLSSGGFVEYEDKVVVKTGAWKVINNHLQITYDAGAEQVTTYQAELVRPEELLLLQGNHQLRLFRLKY